jgi:hypothetical protein
MRRIADCLPAVPSAVGPAKADARRFRSPGSTLQQLALVRQKVNFYQNGRNSARWICGQTYSQK